MMNAAEYNRRGVLAKRDQDFVSAAEYYQKAISLQPSLAEAHFNLGVLRRESGNATAAIGPLECALRLRPDVVAIRIQLAQVQADLGRNKAALQTLEQAVASQVESPELYFCRGNVLYQSECWEQACQAYRTALKARPDWVAPAINLANAQRELGDTTQAKRWYERALELDPHSSAALTNLAQLHRTCGALAESLAIGRRAIQVNPRQWEAHLTLGNVLAELGQLSEAVECYEQAIELRPDRTEGYTYLADTLRRLGRNDEAATWYETALDVDPSDPQPAVGLGNLRCQTGDYEDARSCYRQAVAAKPDDPLVRLRAATVCPLVFDSPAAMQSLRRSIMDETAACRDARLTTPTSHVAPALVPSPFQLQFLEGNLRELKKQIAAVYGWYFSRGPGARLPRCEGSPKRGSEGKLGFLVTRSHEAGFIRSMSRTVRHLSRTGFETVVACAETAIDVVRKAFEGSRVAIVPLPERFDLAASAIAAERFDLIYYWEVGTDPTNYFLPFLRLAPTQCTSLGVQVTSAAPQLDFYLSSHELESDESDQHYTEELILADELLIEPYEQDQPLPPRTRAAFGIAEEITLYGCLQNLGKIHPDFDDPLATILRSDPNSRVVLIRDLPGKAAECLRNRWQRSMPDVTEQVLFVPPLERHDYLALLNQCDVCLDPIHFGGVNTTWDAIAQGKPVVTRATDQQRGRYTAACLTRLDLGELVTTDLASYAQVAVRIGADRDRRSQIQARIRENLPRLPAGMAACAEHERIFHELLARVR